ncbi:GNAT family N-acetyltransferase [Arthrobacter sp. Y-9]|uniref:GNAT family N-acetyltransferase n=1 Tax=Arthrobacter sp. Y-9 TaxID=3039385 RepID=UPI00241DA068|nr:GNAT family N-acetyltransferase [Arthrobacter sp. Y-9]WFR85230.1 GNAT family N-acetyltransferase [Arthrobacter sp. Y-9]
MSPLRHPHPLTEQAQRAAQTAADAAGVTLRDEHDLERHREIEALLVSVWGMSPQGAPIPFDVLRGISHAGCNISTAYLPDGRVCGAAVALVTPDHGSYSLIAGVAPGIGDKGVGFALKQHQRAWCLERGIETMSWTFDPLVSRNARFNLAKLGAHVTEYARNFYGIMDDEINAQDESDRLVAVWPLASEDSVACSEGRPRDVELPPAEDSTVLATGPDGEAHLLRSGDTLWARAPRDIVALRTQNPDLAAAWRRELREVFESAFAADRTADGVTRDGWYRLSPALASEASMLKNPENAR